MTSSLPQLPDEFRDLQPFAAWALAGEKARYERRLAQPMEELQSFYDAALPRVDAACAYVDQFPLDALPDDARNLLNLFCALVTVSFPVEVWRQQRVPDSGASEFNAVVEPAV